MISEGHGVVKPSPQDADTINTVESEEEKDKINNRQGSVFTEDAEARAILEATAKSDSNYVPSTAVLSNPSHLPLMRQVDGIDLKLYNGSPSVYQAKNIPVGRRDRVDLPIYVTSSGSVVDYAVETADYDIGFGVTAERDEKETVVKEVERVDSNLNPVTGRFLVGTVPCALVFTFDNEYSWVREKLITYKVTITPPSKEVFLTGRRRRATSAIKTVEEDKSSALGRLEKASAQRTSLTAEILRMEEELEEKKKSLDVVQKEEDWLVKRVALREEQNGMLKERLEKGWDDED